MVGSGRLFGRINAVCAAISRADIIRGRIIRRIRPVRPPFAISESEFRSRCTRCDDCRKACETGIIGQDKDGYPSLLFGQAGCTFCGACVDACSAGAMSVEAARPWRVSARVKGTCLSVSGVVCRSCGDNCDHRAIGFRLLPQGRAQPFVDEAACTGCGFCATVCPNGSVELRAKD